MSFGGRVAQVHEGVVGGGVCIDHFIMDVDRSSEKRIERQWGHSATADLRHPYRNAVLLAQLAQLTPNGNPAWIGPAGSGRAEDISDIHIRGPIGVGVIPNSPDVLPS